MRQRLPHDILGSASLQPRWLRLCAPAAALLLCLLSGTSVAGAQTVTNLTLSPTSIAANTTSTGTVTLTGAANVTVICLNTSSPDLASVPSSCTVTNNSATFTVTAHSCPGTAIIVASCNGSSRTANITVTGDCSSSGGSGTYLYQVVDQPTTSLTVTNLRLDDIYMPRTVKTAWGSIITVSPTFEVKRNTTTLGTTSNMYYDDATGFSSGTLYQYSVRITGGSQTLGLPAPPMGADPTKIAHLYYVSGNCPWTTINVTPNEALATDNQTVDSRYDLRYSTYVLKDFQFANKVYRGGLFAGYGNDPARVGRSFLKYTLPAWPTGQNMWVISSVNAYYTRSHKTGTATIGCQVTSTGWTQGALVWSNAPAVTPGSPAKTTTVTYDGTDASAKWCRFDLLPDIIAALQTPSRVFGCALASTDESNAQWAYFAKKEWNNGAYAPIVLYAYGAPLQLYTVSVNPSSVAGGSTTTATVELNGPAPTGGFTFDFWTDKPGSAYPAVCSVTIPAGAVTTSFTIQTNTVASDTAVAVWVSNPTLGRTYGTFTVLH